ncbi:hypothetical protein JCM10207_002569 [Rhodosporidiobolus poonsookiae]
MLSHTEQRPSWWLSAVLFVGECIALHPPVPDVPLALLLGEPMLGLYANLSSLHHFEANSWRRASIRYFLAAHLVWPATVFSSARFPRCLPTDIYHTLHFALLALFFLICILTGVGDPESARQAAEHNAAVRATAIAVACCPFRLAVFLLTPILVESGLSRVCALAGRIGAHLARAAQEKARKMFAAGVRRWRNYGRGSKSVAAEVTGESAGKAKGDGSEEWKPPHSAEHGLPLYRSSSSPPP